MVAAAGSGVVAGGCHGVGGPGQAVQALALAQPPGRDCKLDPFAGTCRCRCRERCRRSASVSASVLALSSINIALMNNRIILHHDIFSPT